MRHKILLVFSLLIIFILSGCSNMNKDISIKALKKPVKVTEVKEILSTKELKYIGIVKPGEIKKISFKASGKISSLKVNEGQEIKKGDTLAILDTKDLSFSVEAAKAAKAAAAAQYEKAINGATAEEIDLASINVTKAKEAYNFANDNLEKLKTLYEQGAISKQDFDKAEMETKIREQEYIGADTLLQQVKNGARKEDVAALKAQLNQADVDVKYKESTIGDAILRADMDGYVMQILSRQGELISAGYPIIILGSLQNIVGFGLTDEDASSLKIGDLIKVETIGSFYEGKIKKIEQIMNMDTRTYNTEVELQDSKLPAGTVVNISIPMEKFNAIMVPLTCILRGNYDYVYVVENNVAKKKEIKLGNVVNDMVEITGLSNGEQLVIEGMKSISDGDEIEIIQ